MHARPLSLLVALLALVISAAHAAPRSLAVTNFIEYRTGAGPAGEPGREAAVFYRIFFKEADAREVYDFFRDDVAAKKDESEMGNKLIREALRAEDYPATLHLLRHRIQLGDAPEEGTAFPAPDEPGAITYEKYRVRLESGARSFDWVRRGSEPPARLLGKGTLVAPSR